MLHKRDVREGVENPRKIFVFIVPGQLASRV